MPAGSLRVFKEASTARSHPFRHAAKINDALWRCIQKSSAHAPSRPGFSLHRPEMRQLGTVFFKPFGHPPRTVDRLSIWNESRSN
jgi:hypothetical protein